MKSKKSISKAKYHIFMIFLVCAWGAEYPIARQATDAINPITLLTIKTAIATVIMGIILIKSGKFQLIKGKQLLIMIASALLGDVIYYSSEYTALTMVSVANITILLGFVPVGSLIVERVLFKRKISPQLMIGIFVCIAGIALTIGQDLFTMGGGKILGYILCFVAVSAWLAYLFVTEHITGDFDVILVAFYQSAMGLIVLSPYALTHLPSASVMNSTVIIELLYLGVVAGAICFLIEITGIQKLGPTISGVYSNFQPVTTAIFGIILLGQNITLLQGIGGVVVIAAGCFVILKKHQIDSLEEKRLKTAKAHAEAEDGAKTAGMEPVGEEE